MVTISPSIDPKSSVLRFRARPKLEFALHGKGIHYIQAEQMIGRSGGYICRVVDRSKTISHDSAHRLAAILREPLEDLFELADQSVWLYDEWLEGRVVSLDGEHARFWSKVNPQGENGCWVWRGSCNSRGYGQFMLNGRPQLASRVAYQIAFAPVEIGISVCHRCDNPPCCNPKHLYLGTHEENVHDMIQKGRSRLGKQRLSVDEVRAIRSLNPRLASDIASVATLYGVHPQTIRDIMSRRTWRALDA